MATIGRIKSLQLDIALALKKVAKGTPQYYRMRRYILATLITDLKVINHLIPRLNGLREDIVKKLVTLWLKRGNSSKTIQSKLSIVRGVCQAHCPELVIPSNRELNLSRPPLKKLKIPVLVPLEQISNPAIRQYCALQHEFGLTQQEELWFRGYMFQANELRLPRQIAYNHRDRAVAVETEQQQHLRQDILTAAAFAKPRCAVQVKAQAKLFSDVLKPLGITQPNYYRYHYIKTRYDALHQSGHKPRDVFQQLRRETGYQSNRPLREILQCLKNF